MLELKQQCVNGGLDLNVRPFTSPKKKAHRAGARSSQRWLFPAVCAGQVQHEPGQCTTATLLQQTDRLCDCPIRRTPRDFAKSQLRPNQSSELSNQWQKATATSLAQGWNEFAWKLSDLAGQPSAPSCQGSLFKKESIYGTLIRVWPAHYSDFHPTWWRGGNRRQS